MKSRIGILATLVVGMLLSTAGAGLAIDGIASSSDNAGVAQYGHKPGNTNPGGSSDGFGVFRRDARPIVTGVLLGYLDFCDI